MPVNGGGKTMKLNKEQVAAVDRIGNQLFSFVRDGAKRWLSGATPETWQEAKESVAETSRWRDAAMNLVALVIRDLNAGVCPLRPGDHDVRTVVAVRQRILEDIADGGGADLGSAARAALERAEAERAERLEGERRAESPTAVAGSVAGRPH